MDLCFPEISVAWTQTRQMLRGKKKEGFWCLAWPSDYTRPWSDVLHGLGDIRPLAGCWLLFADLHARETVWPEARDTSACLWCSASVDSHVGSGVSCAKQSLNISHTTHYPGLDSYLLAGQTVAPSAWYRGTHDVPTRFGCITTTHNWP